MDNTQVLVGLTSAVIGGVIATFLKTFLEKKKETQMNLQRITEDKYRSLLVFMACAIDVEKKRYFTLNEQIENKTAEDYLNQIKEYYYHSLLYSSDEVIAALKQFIHHPSQHNYVYVAQEMRKDLWGNSTKLDWNDLILEEL